MDKIRMAVIGLGCRGYSLLEDVFLHHPDVEWTAVCDVYEDRAKAAADLIEEKTGRRPFTTLKDKEVIERDDVDAVFLATAWEHHIDLAIAAMEAGKYVACEVGGAYSIRDCWRLVETYERTGVPVMLMENCVYGRTEMMLYKMQEDGALGEIVHCEGGYRHDLREEVAFGKENRHYRLNNYLHRNTENYPTHELGPIARLLKINRGNRMMTLTAMASKAAGLRAYIAEKKPAEDPLQNVEFKQGDVVNTLIRCANGETILLTLDTTLPRYYSRGLVVEGTKGMYCEENDSVLLDGDFTEEEAFYWNRHWGNAKDYRDRFEHPTWKAYLEEGVKRGHGGMDWLVFCAFAEAVKNRAQVPIDVYDMAAWMSITALAEESIALGGQPVAIPDFTGGRWMTRE